MRFSIQKMLMWAILAGLLGSCSASGPDPISMWEGKSLFDQRKYQQALTVFEGVYQNKPQERELAWQYILKSRRALASVVDKSVLAVATSGRAAKTEFVCGEDGSKPTEDRDQYLVSAMFVEADLREVLLELSVQSGVTIVPDETVQGQISANIQNQPLGKSLKMILAPGNFSYRLIEGFYLVGESTPENPSFHLLSETCLYKPIHLSPKEVHELISPYYRRFVTLHEKRGLLTVVAPTSIQRRIQKDVLMIDRQPHQVLLEMTILEITQKGRKFLGIDWTGGQGASEESGGVGSSWQVSGNGGGIGLQYKMANLLTTEFAASVKWLSRNGDASLKATPSIVTLDGRMASFSSTHESWIDLTPNDETRKNESVRFGVELKIIPHIAETNDVVLDILTAQVSDLTTSDRGFPEIVSHSISTTVRIREGESLILGGLLQKKRRFQLTKVPVLGDIPLLGVFFREEKSQNLETEILIVIRPTILSNKPVILREREPAPLGSIPTAPPSDVNPGEDAILTE